MVMPTAARARAAKMSATEARERDGVTRDVP
jgi:hypothetical protein